jgi:hypothetical protein
LQYKNESNNSHYGPTHLGTKIPFALKIEQSNFIDGSFVAAQGSFMKPCSNISASESNVVFICFSFF